MRTVTAPIAAALTRRGIALERDAMIALRRDAYAEPPGPMLGLAVGERTHYRNGAWNLDTFERATLGPAYPAWGGSPGLTLSGGHVIPVSVGPAGMVTHRHPVPRDPWAAVEVVALAGPSAAVGVLLRATETDAYRVLATSTGQTVVASIAGGTAATLTTVATPWRVGDVLRVELVWTRLRVYREPILVAEVTVPAPEPGPGFAGFVAWRAVSGDAAALQAFVAGEARQEYIGAGLDLGDIQRVLGQPAAFDVTLSNVAPLGGTRFAALLRHGLNTTNTYDLDRGDVRILSVIDGLAPPLTAGVGWIDGPGEVTEDRVRLVCRGRDAFLTPLLEPGVVMYIPGPPPGGLTPLPADLCAPAVPPVIVVGSIPGEPALPPLDDTGEGIGPDAPPHEAEGAVALRGTWIVEWDYTLTPAAYVGSTTVTQIPDPDHAAQGYTNHDFFRPGFQYTLGTGTAAAPTTNREVWIYRGPNIGGLSLVPNLHYGPGSGTLVTRSGVTAGYADGSINSGSLSLTLKLARYDATGIETTEDLAALRPQHPSSVDATIPARIGTLDEWTITTPFGAPNRVIEDVLIPLTLTTGPQLLRLEVVGTTWAAGGSPTRLAFGRVTTYTASADPLVATSQHTSELGVFLGASLKP